jgi:hypothetical protein
MTIIRYSLALAIGVLGLGLIIGSGGGGDDGGSVPDGGDAGGDDPVTILTTYNMILTDLPDENLLTADVGNDYSVALDFDGSFFTTINLDVAADNSVTLLSYTAQATSGFDLVVSSEAASPLEATISVTLTENIDVNVDEAPTSGAFTVDTLAGTVGVEFDDGDVAISLGGGAPIIYTWSQFEDLLDDETAEAWQRLASLAANSLEVVYDMFVLVAERLDKLEAVTTTNPTVETCDMFTGTPPAGVMAQGENVITWLGSGELSDGDDFQWEFTDCWFDDSSNEVDGLFDGIIQLQDYTETVDFATNTLFEIGFGSLGDGPGGIVFDLDLAETRESNGGFTIAPEDVLTITGGFVLIIQQF